MTCIESYTDNAHPVDLKRYEQAETIVRVNRKEKLANIIHTIRHLDKQMPLTQAKKFARDALFEIRIERLEQRIENLENNTNILSCMDDDTDLRKFEICSSLYSEEGPGEGWELVRRLDRVPHVWVYVGDEN